MQTISKAEVARRWNVSKAMVTKYLGLGMPELPSGKLDWPVVDKWRKDNVVSELSGNYYARQGRVATPQLADAKTVVDALHQNGVDVLVKLATGLGLTPLQTHTAFEAMTAWVDATLGEQALRIIYGSAEPPRVDYSPLDTVKLSKAESKKLDGIVEQITAILAVAAERG